MPDAVAQPLSQARQIVAKLDTISTLPEVTSRITATIRDPKSTSKDLHRIISHDPALVTRILKLVNSAFYARTTKIDSVERAIVLLGFDGIHKLAIAASMGQLFKGVKLCPGFTAKDLWTHCIGVGVVAREMAKLIKKEIAEECFLAGLVHDVGLLATLQLYPEKLQQVCETAQKQQVPFCVLEQDIIGVDHQELGVALAERWGFPMSCHLAAQHHHHPSLFLSDEEDERLLVALIHVADCLVCGDRIGFNLTAVHQSMDEAGIQGLVPYPVVQQMSERLTNVVWTAVRIFG